MTASGPAFELRVVLTVDDYDAAVRLWRDGLGLPVERSFDGGLLLTAGRGTVEILTRDAAAGVEKLEAGGGAPAPFRLAIEVANSEKSAAAMTAAGARKTGGPVTAPWGHRSVRLATSEGIGLTLFSVVQPSAG
jgi:catechol 2,3-dioxygenase-like lactoylglutathione lyase family enzyme